MDFDSPSFSSPLVGSSSFDGPIKGHHFGGRFLERYSIRFLSTSDSLLIHQITNSPAQIEIFGEIFLPTKNKSKTTFHICH